MYLFYETQLIDFPEQTYVIHKCSAPTNGFMSVGDKDVLLNSGNKLQCLSRLAAVEQLDQ